MVVTPLNVTNVQGQQGFFNKYPYTDFHEMNLDFLLTEYQAIVDKTNTIIDWVNNHQIEYEEAIQRLTAVENEIATFEQRVEAEFEALSQHFEEEFARQTEMLNQELARVKAEIAQEMLVLRQEVEQAITEFRNEVEQLKVDVANAIIQLKAEVNQAIIQMYSILEANNEYVFNYVENRLQEFIDSFPEIITVYVYNPCRGYVTNVQTAINDLYSVACVWGLTAEQYDSLELTASEYDALQLTATEYDQYGYKLLYKDPANYMISPFTGEYVRLQEVITDLAHLHMGGITAENYDNLEYTAEYYDSLELTAFNYDWFGDELLTA